MFSIFQTCLTSYSKQDILVAPWLTGNGKMLAYWAENQNHCNILMSLFYCVDKTQHATLMMQTLNRERSSNVAQEVRECYCCNEELNKEKRTCKHDILDSSGGRGRARDPLLTPLLQHLCKWLPMLDFYVTHQAFF